MYTLWILQVYFTGSHIWPVLTFFYKYNTPILHSYTSWKVYTMVDTDLLRKLGRDQIYLSVYEMDTTSSVQK